MLYEIFLIKKQNILQSLKEVQKEKLVLKIHRINLQINIICLNKSNSKWSVQLIFQNVFLKKKEKNR